jgi:hypothetical protein
MDSAGMVKPCMALQGSLAAAGFDQLLAMANAANRMGEIRARAGGRERMGFTEVSRCFRFY